MAAIRHKLSARPSSGTPSASSTRGVVVVLLKTFASIRPSRSRPPVSGWRATKAKNWLPSSDWGLGSANFVLRYHLNLTTTLQSTFGVRAIAVMPRPKLWSASADRDGGLRHVAHSKSSGLSECVFLGASGSRSALSRGAGGKADQAHREAYSELHGRL